MWGEREYDFVNMVSKSFWTGGEKHKVRNTTYDGVTFQIEGHHQILGLFYFYHTEKVEYFRVVMSWLEVASSVGGLNSNIVLFFGLISMWYNQKFQVSDVISKFYYFGVRDSQRVKPAGSH